MTSHDLDIAIDGLLESRPDAKAEFVQMLCLETALSLGNAECVVEIVERVARLGIRVPLEVLDGRFVLELLSAYERAALEISRAHERYLGG